MTESKKKLQFSLLELIGIILYICSWPIGLMYISINKLFTHETRHKLFIVGVSMTVVIAIGVVAFSLIYGGLNDLYNFQIGPRLGGFIK
jgi:hypothetical protein